MISANQNLIKTFLGNSLRIEALHLTHYLQILTKICIRVNDPTTPPYTRATPTVRLLNRTGISLARYSGSTSNMLVGGVERKLFIAEV
jgi:hypothetical protein